MRVHAFEFNERPECPRFLREAIVEALGTGLRWGRIYDGVGPVFAEFCARAGCDEVLDLCSGSGEPVSILLGALARAGVAAPRFVLSDLLPNVPAMEQVAARHPGRIEVVARPVDATAVPAEVDRPARTVISAFHHLPPDLARGLLADCVARRRAVFLLEALSGDLRGLLAILPAMTAAALATPLLTRRDRLKKALATWAVPVVPALGLWDAVVSDLRTYRADELRAMVAPLGGGYAWEHREVPFFPGGRATCFFGVPPR
ncbi:MAG: class I SAM-dependent methyltransferase [Planctomycetes bacterium]|nr:class I SAM-dependent methyltransferase [Planctomycetota bacterium]